MPEHVANHKTKTISFINKVVTLKYHCSLSKYTCILLLYAHALGQDSSLQQTQCSQDSKHLLETTVS